MLDLLLPKTGPAPAADAGEPGSPPLDPAAGRGHLDPRKAAPAPAPGQARRPLGGRRHGRPHHAHGGGLLERRAGGDGDQLQGHAGRALPQGGEAPAAEGPRGAGGARAGGGAEPGGPRQGRAAVDREGRAVRDHLHRRDRQDRGQGRSLPRAGRLARGGAAGPAAGGRGLHGDDQARPGQDRPHPVHRLGRLSHGQALRPHPGAAGAVPDPGRAGRARGRRSSCAS